MIKRTLYISAALAALCACSGTVDPEAGNPGEDIPEEFTAPYTLSADKEEVEASGTDLVTFSLKDAYGREMLTDKKTLQSVNIVSEEGVRVTRMETQLGFISNGTFNFTASYKGEKSENTFQVTAKNRAKYEKFHKNVAIWKATATWCGPCAYMTNALEGIDEDAKAHSVEICWHYQDDLSIYAGGDQYDCGTRLVSVLGGAGVPTVGLDLVKTVIERSSSVISSDIWNIRRDYPATCGIKLNTVYDKESDTIDIEGELTSATGGEYDMGFAVLLNDQIVAEGTNDGGKYSHIARATTANYYMYSDGIVEVAKDASKIFSIQDVALSGLDIDNLSVVAWALVKHENGARIDNIVEVKAGESIDYRYND